MTEALRSVVAAVGIVLGCACVYGGIALRSRVDLSGANFTASTNNSMLSTWVASRDNSNVTIPVQDYYAQMVDLLKHYYVEPITNDQKLATGSVRGMISSLGDLNSVFMEPDQFRAYNNRQEGIYEGIGVNLTLEYPTLASLSAKRLRLKQAGPSARIQAVPVEDADEAVARMQRIPRLIVTAVVPGGPADGAGVRVGDQVSYIGDHWVLDEALIDKFRDEQRLLIEKKIKYSDIEPMQKELRQKTERALLPYRAGDQLMVGKTGSVTVVWIRNGQPRTTKLSKGISRMPGFAVNGTVIRLPVTMAGASGLHEALKDRRKLTIDLRNEPEGDYSAITPILRDLAPTGTYGEFLNSREGMGTPLTIESGNQHPPQLTLLVDESTNGPAAIIASALSSHGRATLKGSEMGGDLLSKQTVALPGGTGYTLATGEYRATVSKPGLVAAEEEKRR